MSLAMRDRVLLVVGRDHAQHRAEDLLLRDGRRVVDVAEHRRLDEPAPLEVLRTSAAGGERRALVDRPSRCSPRRGRAAGSWRSGPICVCSSNGSPTCTWAKLAASASTISSWRSRVTTIRVSDEHTWPVMMHSAPAIVAATVRDVGVVEDDRRRLAAELERAARDALAAERRDLAAGRRRAGERDLVDPRVAHQQFRHLAVGGHDVEHARRAARSASATSATR